MHPRSVVELAAIVAANGPARIRCHQRLADAGLLQYWAATRYRLNSWMRALKTLASGAGARQDSSLPSLVAEILSADVLTRVWTAVGCGCDAALGMDEAAPILMNVWSSQLEARQRVLSLLVAGRGLCYDEVLAANRVRRMSERWADLLLGHVAGVCTVDRFAHSSRRLARFAAAVRGSGAVDSGGELLRLSLRLALPSFLSAPAVNPELNRQIAQSILICFPSDCFDATGLPKGVGLMNIEQHAPESRAAPRDLLSGLDLPGLPRNRFPRARRR